MGDNVGLGVVGAGLLFTGVGDGDFGSGTGLEAGAGALRASFRSSTACGPALVKHRP